MALRALLVNPQFLFRIEKDPPNAAPKSVCRVSDLELASRLSFFLWSSIPDDELLDAASQGKLKDPAELERQVRRMLADERSELLVTNFAEQWLYLRNLESASPDPRLFPDFDDNLRQAFPAGDGVVPRQHSSRGPECARFAAGGLYVSERTAGETLRDTECVRQPLPARELGEHEPPRRIAESRAAC